MVCPFDMLTILRRRREREKTRKRTKFEDTAHFHLPRERKQAVLLPSNEVSVSCGRDSMRKQTEKMQPKKSPTMPHSSELVSVS